MPPALSVVMPVNNGRYMKECVESILHQSFADFEFVVLSDNVDVRSRAQLREWCREDPRMRLVDRVGRQGAVGAYNEAVGHARAPVVARMDADDIAHPDRLRRQFEVLRERPDAVLVGTLFDGIDASGRQTRPLDRSTLRPGVFAPFPHGSAMFRRPVFDRVGGYRGACAGWAELDLFLRMAAYGRVFVLPDALYHYRYHQESISVRRPQQEDEHNTLRMQRCLAAFRAGEPYELLLEAESPEVIPADCRQLVYTKRAAHALWSGLRPRPCPPWGWRTTRALLYGVWGTASPRTLRLVLRGMLRARDAAAARRLGEGPHEWQFRCSPEAPGATG